VFGQFLALVKTNSNDFDSIIVVSVRLRMPLAGDWASLANR
jgi:hypothetical protein